MLSPRAYHQVTNFAVVCPITNICKGYPFEVPLPAGLPVTGVILADQVKSIDHHIRRIERFGKAPESVVQEVVAKVMPLLLNS